MLRLCCVAPSAAAVRACLRARPSPLLLLRCASTTPQRVVGGADASANPRRHERMQRRAVAARNEGRRQSYERVAVTDGKGAYEEEDEDAELDEETKRELTQDMMSIEDPEYAVLTKRQIRTLHASEYLPLTPNTAWLRLPEVYATVPLPTGMPATPGELVGEDGADDDGGSSSSRVGRRRSARSAGGRSSSSGGGVANSSWAVLAGSGKLLGMHMSSYCLAWPRHAAKGGDTSLERELVEAAGLTEDEAADRIEGAGETQHDDIASAFFPVTLTITRYEGAVSAGSPLLAAANGSASGVARAFSSLHMVRHGPAGLVTPREGTAAAAELADERTMDPDRISSKALEAMVGEPELESGGHGGEDDDDPDADFRRKLGLGRGGSGRSGGDADDDDAGAGGGSGGAGDESGVKPVIMSTYARTLSLREAGWASPTEAPGAAPSASEPRVHVFGIEYTMPAPNPAAKATDGVAEDGTASASASASGEGDDLSPADLGFSNRFHVSFFLDESTGALTEITFKCPGAWWGRVWGEGPGAAEGDDSDDEAEAARKSSGVGRSIAAAAAASAAADAAAAAAAAATASDAAAADGSGRRRHVSASMDRRKKRRSDSFHGVSDLLTSLDRAAAAETTGSSSTSSASAGGGALVTVAPPGALSPARRVLVEQMACRAADIPSLPPSAVAQAMGLGAHRLVQLPAAMVLDNIVFSRPPAHAFQQAGVGEGGAGAAGAAGGIAAR